MLCSRRQTLTRKYQAWLAADAAAASGSRRKRAFDCPPAYMYQGILIMQLLYRAVAALVSPPEGVDLPCWPTPADSGFRQSRHGVAGRRHLLAWSENQETHHEPLRRDVASAAGVIPVVSPSMARADDESDQGALAGKPRSARSPPSRTRKSIDLIDYIGNHRGLTFVGGWEAVEVNGSKEHLDGVAHGFAVRSDVRFGVW
jgi:hypothetical protein